MLHCLYYPMIPQNPIYLGEIQTNADINQIPKKKDFDTTNFDVFKVIYIFQKNNQIPWVQQEVEINNLVFWDKRLAKNMMPYVEGRETSLADLLAMFFQVTSNLNENAMDQFNVGMNNIVNHMILVNKGLEIVDVSQKIHGKEKTVLLTNLTPEDRRYATAFLTWLMKMSLTRKNEVFQEQEFAAKTEFEHFKFYSANFRDLILNLDVKSKMQHMGDIYSEQYFTYQEVPKERIEKSGDFVSRMRDYLKKCVTLDIPFFSEADFSKEFDSLFGKFRSTIKEKTKKKPEFEPQKDLQAEKVEKKKIEESMQKEQQKTDERTKEVAKIGEKEKEEESESSSISSPAEKIQVLSQTNQKKKKKSDHPSGEDSDEEEFPEEPITRKRGRPPKRGRGKFKGK